MIGEGRGVGTIEDTSHVFTVTEDTGVFTFDLNPNGGTISGFDWTDVPGQPNPGQPGYPRVAWNVGHEPFNRGLAGFSAALETWRAAKQSLFIRLPKGRHSRRRRLLILVSPI